MATQFKSEDCPGRSGRSVLFLALTGLALAACQPDSAPAPEGALPAGDEDTRPYDGIRESETLRFTGTEPFWGGDVTGSRLTYSTIEDQDGTAIEVERFAGRGGLSFHGQLHGQDFEMMITELGCSDGMSDRTYPFTVTLQIDEDTRNGCGWTERMPFDGPETP